VPVDALLDRRELVIDARRRGVGLWRAAPEEGGKSPVEHRQARDLAAHLSKEHSLGDISLLRKKGEGPLEHTHLARAGERFRGCRVERLREAGRLANDSVDERRLLSEAIKEEDAVGGVCVELEEDLGQVGLQRRESPVSIDSDWQSRHGRTVRTRTIARCSSAWEASSFCSSRSIALACALVAEDWSRRFMLMTVCDWVESAAVSVICVSWSWRSESISLCGRSEQESVSGGPASRRGT
jgi:hypothetical protein